MNDKNLAYCSECEDLVEFTEKEVEEIISEYVRAQILSPRLRYYIRKG